MTQHKKPTKKQLLTALKKHNWIKLDTASVFGVDETTVRRWCRKYEIDTEFEKKKDIVEYQHVNVLPKKGLKVEDSKSKQEKPVGIETRRNFVLSDTQIPYHSELACDIALERANDYLNDSKFNGETYFTIIGDFMDYEPLLGKAGQRYPRLETECLKALDLEFIQARKMLDRIEKVLPAGCKKIFIKGNHEDRADKIIETPDGDYWKQHIETNERLGLSESGWKVLKYNESFKLGHLHYTHGAFHGKYHAEQHARHWAKNIMYGHTHQVQVFTMPSPAKELPVWAASIGCLANVNPEWQRNKPNAHEHAFAEVSYIGEDFFPAIHRIVRKKLIIPGGKVYTA